MTDTISLWVMTNIPPPVRHFVAAFLGAFILFVAQAIQSEGSPDWGAGAKEALVAAVGTLAVLTVTPLTDAYGTGKGVGEAVQAAEVAAVIDEATLPDETPAEPYVEPVGVEANGGPNE